MYQNVHVLPKLFTGVLRKTKVKPADNSVSGTMMDESAVDSSTQSPSSLQSTQARARFVLSPELSEAYPEDEAIGDAWLIG